MSKQAQVLKIDPAAIFDRIRSNITKSFEYRQAALEDVVFVYKKRVWKLANYSSFEECLEAELNIERFPLKRDERKEAVAFLRAAGLSARGIGAALGISHMTAERDIQSGGTNVPPGGDGSSDRTTGLDGKSYSRNGSGGKRYPNTRNQSDCLTPKLVNTIAAARQLGEFSLEVGAKLVKVRQRDWSQLTMEELEQLSDHIYRARHGLKNCNARLPD